MSAPTARAAGGDSHVSLNLTARQLEVTMLLRGGLRHGEIAALLGISRSQVARLAGQARERASAGTSSHLVAMVARSGGTFAQIAPT